MTRVVVVGGTGLVGARLVRRLAGLDVEVVAAARSTGVDARTGRGLAPALHGAAVVVDVTDAGALDERRATEHFATATRRLLATGAEAGVGHHVVLSIVGVDRLLEGGYFRAKAAQEGLVLQGAVPFTVVRATQFFEFVGTIADAFTDGDTVRVPPVLVRPVAADDLAAALADLALGPPANGVVEVAGPEELALDDLVRRWLAARGDARGVVADPDRRYFGARVAARGLLPRDGAVQGATRLDRWLAARAAARSGAREGI